MRVLACGSRDWQNWLLLFCRMRKLPEGSTIIHGAAGGADRMAGRAALKLGLEEIACPADWERYGKAAGFKRNIEMLDMEPEMVLAFQVGRSSGTQHTIDQAVRRGIPVQIYRP